MNIVDQHTKVARYCQQLIVQMVDGLGTANKADTLTLNRFVNMVVKMVG